jgi:hypothetical protein
LSNGDSIEFCREAGSRLCPTGAGAFAEMVGQMLEHRLARSRVPVILRHTLQTAALGRALRAQTPVREVKSA